MVDCLIGFPHFGHGSLVNKVKDTVIFFRTGERTLKGVQLFVSLGRFANAPQSN
jgi:hypothetical protein